MIDSTPNLSILGPHFNSVGYLRHFKKIGANAHPNPPKWCPWVRVVLVASPSPGYFFFVYGLLDHTSKHKSFHPSRFCTTCANLHPRVDICYILLIQSSHRTRGLPNGLFHLGFSCRTVSTISLGFLYTWPANSSLFLFIFFAIFGLLYIS